MKIYEDAPPGWTRRQISQFTYFAREVDGGRGGIGTLIWVPSVGEPLIFQSLALGPQAPVTQTPPPVLTGGRWIEDDDEEEANP